MSFCFSLYLCGFSFNFLFFFFVFFNLGTEIGVRVKEQNGTKHTKFIGSGLITDDVCVCVCVTCDVADE